METQHNTCVAWIVVALAVGLVAGVLLDPYLPSSLSNSKKGYATGFTAARTLVENSSFGALFKSPDDIRSLQGTVTSIEGNSIVLHLASNNPFDDQTLNDRTVLVATSTQILTLTLEKTKVTTSVQSFTPTKVDVSTIKVGDTIVVTASENIKTLKEFTVSQIQVHPTLAK